MTLAKTTTKKNHYSDIFKAKKNALGKFIKGDPYLISTVQDGVAGTLFAKAVCFISVTDGTFRARVFSAAEYDVSDAFEKACEKAENFVAENNVEVLWLKADFVNYCKIVSYKSYIAEVKEAREFFYKKGVSFDVDFDMALLEAQLNCGGLIDYKSCQLNVAKIREYFASIGNDRFKSIPSNVIEFTTVGYICDEDMNTYKLYPDEENYGRRVVKELTKEDIGRVIRRSSVYLANAIDENGKFDYGVNPVTDFHFITYNILRHAGTIWSVIMQYDTTKDEALIPKIESAIGYMLNSIESPDDDHAYLIERKADEIKLGGNAVAIITLSTYMQVFKSDKYKELIRKIANSILDSQEADGSYYHVLSYPDYKRKERDRIVYYDGEATFALARAYSVTGDERFLNAAKKALDYFIENDYTRFCDHWIAYSVNEVTMYDPEEKYLNFGLRNANENLTRIFNQDTTFHTFLELLMAAYELYERVVSKKLNASYMQKFNREAFIRTIYRRAHYMLNGYLYPEFAMYMKNPLGVAETFCVRHDSYRVRIDDVQHYIGGYYNFYKHFDKLQQYYDKIVNKPVEKPSVVSADAERASFVNWILNNI
ncbi:MAG: glycosyl hydrolase family 88 [Ruminococcaceae bacterium]|nr:glycosyl hydrolase family 88 [Oscillospiraceae bacterium]